MTTEPGVRLDKWLWAARLYKTRSLASKACEAKQVVVGGTPGKPSRTVRAGELIEVKLRDIARTVRVKKATENRVGPKLVEEVYEDLTPPSEYERQKEYWQSSPAQRLRGAGRPTKKDRRELGKYFGL